jgi:hypothetical protein
MYMLCIKVYKMDTNVSFLHDKDKQCRNRSPNKWDKGDSAAWFE